MSYTLKSRHGFTYQDMLNYISVTLHNEFYKKKRRFGLGMVMVKVSPLLPPHVAYRLNKAWNSLLVHLSWRFCFIHLLVYLFVCYLFNLVAVPYSLVCPTEQCSLTLYSNYCTLIIPQCSSCTRRTPTLRVPQYGIAHNQNKL